MKHLSIMFKVYNLNASWATLLQKISWVIRIWKFQRIGCSQMTCLWLTKEGLKSNFGKRERRKFYLIKLLILMAMALSLKKTSRSLMLLIKTRMVNSTTRNANLRLMQSNQEKPNKSGNHIPNQVPSWTNNRSKLNTTCNRSPWSQINLKQGHRPS